MTCRCQGQLDLRRTRAAMCVACPRARAYVICSVDGRATRGRALCPLGRFPDRLGLVRWLGLRWRGVPWPLRVLDDDLAGVSLPGCGCVDALKRAWEWIVKAARGRTWT